MNTWILPICDAATSKWAPAQPPMKLHLLRLNETTGAYSFIISKEATGTCMLKLQLPGLQVALNELSDRQARSLAIACLLQAPELGALNAGSSHTEVVHTMEQLADAPGVESGMAMFPEWYRGNFRQNPECMSKAAECLRTRRLSAGSGIKVMVTDDADFADVSRADIILSASPQSKAAAAHDVEWRKALPICAGVVALGAVCAYGLVRHARRK